MTSKQQCKSLEQVTPLTDDECLLRLHFSPEHILEGRVVPAAISTTDLGEKGFSLDRELLVDLDIVEARARTQSTRMPEKRESSYLSCFNCGNVRIIKSDGQDAFKVEESPIADNFAHAHILSAQNLGKGGLKKLRNLLLPYLQNLISLNEYRENSKKKI